MKMDELLTHVLEPDESASEELNHKILREYRKVNTMNQTRKILRFPKLATTVCALVLLCSITTVAAIKYFAPSEIAMEIEDKTLANAFESESAVLINETQSFKNYNVTLLGWVSGEDLTDFVSESDTAAFELATGRSYIVTAIEKSDGTAMPNTSDNDYGKTPFFVSPYIKGENPAFVNAFTLNGGYSEIVKDGVMYRILECDTIEIFADKGVYLGISTSTFYDATAYNWNETDGTLTANPDYEGVNALFTLPLDKTKADPEVAKQYLDAVLNPNTDTEKDTDTALISKADMDEAPALLTDMNDEEYAEFVRIRQLSPNSPEFNDYYTLLEDSVQVVTPDEDNMIYAEYGDSSSYDSFTELFPDNTPGFSEIYGCSITDTGWLKCTYELMEDGTVTLRVYEHIFRTE